MAQEARSNPLLQPWAGSHGGLPPFDQVGPEDFSEALEAGVAELRASVRTLIAQTEPPDFENTLAAFESVGALLQRVKSVVGVFFSTLSSPRCRELEAEWDPKLTAVWSEVYQNQALFQRIQQAHALGEEQDWTEEQRRLADETLQDFRRRGAHLEPDQRARLAEINLELARLYTRFRQNLMADEEHYLLLQEDQLTGLPASLRDAMAAAAEERGHPGQWAVLNTRSMVEPFLCASQSRSLRDQVWRSFAKRGDHPGDHNNKPLIPTILRLRRERSDLLGYPSHAHWQLESSMAGSPERASRLMERLWEPAVQRAREEVALQQELMSAEAPGETIEAWDYRYYLERVRAQRYAVDDGLLKPYLQLEQLREGMFWMAGELYGLGFTLIPDAPVLHPDVRAWSVESAEGEHVGTFYFDPYARTGKRSGAWMNAYRSQQRLGGEIRPIVSNNCNFVKAPEGQPTLLSWDDAETLFHEFGHGLHGLLSQVTYPSLAGTSVARDYVEFPSQIHEHWLRTPEILQRFALHAESGEPLPESLLSRLDAATTFGSGFATVEFLASAILDMKIHLVEGEVDPAAFEDESLRSLGMPSEIIMRHRLPQFAHIFSSDGYSASYYCYLWADALTADAVEAFHDAPGGMYDADMAQRLKDLVLSRGNTVDPAAAFQAFRGREVEIAPLLRERGFAPPRS